MFKGDMTIKVCEDQKGEAYFIQNVTKITKDYEGENFIIGTLFDEIKIPVYDKDNPGDGTVIEIS